MIGGLNVWQINLQHSKAATSNLYKSLDKINDQALVCCQEPYTYEGQLRGLSGKRYWSGGENPLTCIIVPPSITAWKVPKFCDNQVTTILVYLNGKRHYISSVYCKQGTDYSAIPKTAECLILEANQKEIGLLLCMDANAYSTFWNCLYTNNRGNDWQELIMSQGLDVQNKGNSPTFVGSRGSSIIDVTLTNQYSEVVTKWRVDKSYSFSDHRYITMSLNCQSELVPRFTRNYKKIDWDQFRTFLDEKMKFSCDVSATISPERLDLEAKSLEIALTETLDKCCPKRQCDPRKPNKWWTLELSELQHKLRKLVRYGDTYGQDREEFVQLKKQYKKSLARAKSESWKRYCSEIEGESVISKRIHSLFKKNSDSQEIPILKRPDGTWCNNEEESVKILMDKHFPNNVPPMVNTIGQFQSDGSLDPKLEPYLTIEKVRQALKSFNANKSPGPDKIRSILLHNASDDFCRRLCDIYKNCLQSGYVPKTWRDIEAIFIPKQGKTDFSDPKSYRPISMSNFMLKGLERIVQWYLEDNELSEPLKTQHAYTKGRSCDSALSTLLNELERSKKKGKKSLMVSLDISGAFDNLKFEDLSKAMKEKKISPQIRNWYLFLSNNRRVSCNLQSTKLEVQPTQGSGQGGVLSPLCWNLVISSLSKMFKGRVKLITYADDVTLVVHGPKLKTLYRLMQSALDKASKWGVDHGLIFNPAKTNAMAVGCRSLPTDSLTLDGAQIKNVESLTYLGVLFDRKLTFNQHLSAKIDKCTKLLFSVRKMVGSDWGLSPKVCKWIYNTFIAPSILYGCHLWATKTITRTIQARLKKLQRLCCLFISGSCRTTPTATMEVALGLMPLDLQAKARAAEIVWRLVGTLDHDPVPSGHLENATNALNNLGIPTLASLKNVKIGPNLSDAVKSYSHTVSSEGFDIICYTDGSKKEGRAGSGWCITSQCHAIKSGHQYFGKTASVFQTETMALTNCLDDLSLYLEGMDRTSVIIYTDCKSLTTLLKQSKGIDRLVQESKRKILQLEQNHNIVISWMKGHSGQTGNEYVDMLAKKGSEKEEHGPEPFLPLSKATVKSTIKQKVDKLWKYRWLKTSQSSHSKKMLPKLSKVLHKKVYQMSRPNIKAMIAMISGHCNLNSHRKRLNLQGNDLCRFCNLNPETPLHWIEECEVFEVRRHEFSALRIAEFRTQSQLSEEIDLLIWARDFLAYCNLWDILKSPIHIRTED